MVPWQCGNCMFYCIYYYMQLPQKAETNLFRCQPLRTAHHLRSPIPVVLNPLSHFVWTILLFLSPVHRCEQRHTAESSSSCHQEWYMIVLALILSCAYPACTMLYTQLHAVIIIMGNFLTHMQEDHFYGWHCSY